MPALIVFRHGANDYAGCHQPRAAQNESRAKTFWKRSRSIQDIRLTNTHRAHIEILSDLSLSALHHKHPFINFVGLHEAWQKTLDTFRTEQALLPDLAIGTSGRYLRSAFRRTPEGRRRSALVEPDPFDHPRHLLLVSKREGAAARCTL